MTVANLTTPPHHTRLPPILPEAYRLAELPELDRTVRHYVLNKWLTSASGRCPRAWVLREICSKLDERGGMTDDAREMLMGDPEKREFYRRTLRYLGIRPPEWTDPGDWSPNSGDEPVGIDGQRIYGELVMARDAAQRVAFADKTSPTHKERVAEVNRQLDELLTERGFVTPCIIS